MQVSEGINFADEYARAVVILGIPFSNLGDSKVQAKRAFNDRRCRRDRGALSGNEHYKLDAFRCQNQVSSRLQAQHGCHQASLADVISVGTNGSWP